MENSQTINPKLWGGVYDATPIGPNPNGVTTTTDADSITWVHPPVKERIAIALERIAAALERMEKMQ